MRDTYLVAGLAILAGVYGLTVRYLRPDVCPPRWTLVSLIAIATGVLVALVDFLFTVLFHSP